MPCIALIEDDVPLGDMLQEVLTREGYAVVRAWSGTQALYLLSHRRPDLALLDLMLPGLSGEEVLPFLEGIPVIVISARAEVEEKVKLLLEGAADYLTKPFDTRELLARIEVQLRREKTGSCPLCVGVLRLDMESLGVWVRGQEVRLTRTEYAILKTLMEHPRQVMVRSLLLDRIREETPDGTERSLKQHISNLRHKLKEAGGVDPIETVWGIGFKLSPEVLEGSRLEAGEEAEQSQKS